MPFRQPAAHVVAVLVVAMLSCAATSAASAGTNTTTPSQTVSRTLIYRTPTIPTPPPTPGPTLPFCVVHRFYCNDTMWRCLRGAAPNKCGCLNTFWDCLERQASCMQSDDALLCNSRSRSLLCTETNCPIEARSRVVAGSGYIVALIFFILSLCAFIAALVYVLGRRNLLPFGLRASWVAPPTVRDAEDPKPGELPDAIARKRGLAPEEPDLINLTPDAVNRYRTYLRANMKGKAGDAASNATGDDDDDDRAGFAQSRSRSRVRAESARSVAEQDEVARAALANDAVDREIQLLREQVDFELKEARRKLINEIALGATNLQEPLPSEMDVTRDGIVSISPGVNNGPLQHRTSRGHSLSPIRANDMQRHYASPSPPLAATTSVPGLPPHVEASPYHHRHGSAAANPISVLFDNLASASGPPDDPTPFASPQSKPRVLHAL